MSESASVAAMTLHPYADIGERLAWHRTEMGLLQSDIADLVGAKRSIWSLWETGHNRITPNAAIRLCELHQLTLDFIYRGVPNALPVELQRSWAEYQSQKK